jgi:iron complex transport system ATP-binding protein
VVARLSARGLVFEYPGPLRALDGVDLEIREGELTVVIGPNGSGKSTLVRTLAGLLAPSAGQVLWGGADLGSPRDRARRIAVVPQFLPALPDVRAHDFVLGGRYVHLGRWGRWQGAGGEDERLARHALEQCDAADLGGRSMATLSGGQRQRVLVARAVCQASPVLLIDEPTNSLDPEHQIRVFELVRGLVAEGRAVVVITHDLNLAGQFADRLVVLDRGRVAADGAVDAVLVPEVLSGVYGPHLYFGRFEGASSRPFVLPFHTNP